APREWGALFYQCGFDYYCLEGLSLPPIPASPASLSYGGSHAADTRSLSAVMPGVGARPAGYSRNLSAVMPGVGARPVGYTRNLPLVTPGMGARPAG
ncbi:MAG: hypothetical protein WBB55_14025, partial [Anaerolineales bacterium]